jgi:hypothetical protein
MMAILDYFEYIYLIYELSSLAITASIMLFYIVLRLKPEVYFKTFTA